ncbi:MAG: MerR family transcriptional regulator, partial [Acidobacteriota bacterium]
MTPPDSSPALHPIRVVARRTGLKTDLIRAWERRYGAIEPQRTAGRHRSYSEEDIHRLLLLRQATESGFPIGQVAQLPTADLEDLVGPA